MPPLNFNEQQPAEQEANNKAQSFFVPITTAAKKISGMGKKVTDFFAPQVWTRSEEEVIKPKIKQTIKDIHGGYKVLDTGTTVRDIPSKLVGAVAMVYQKHPDLPKGIVEAVLQQESSMGTARNNYNPDIGEYAWLVGFTKIAKKELIRNGIHPDLSTPIGAINAMADFIALKQHIKDETGKVVQNRTDPVDIYNSTYSSGKLKPETLQQFKEIVQYHGG